MRFWPYKRHSIGKQIAQRNVIPFADLFRIEMIDRAEAEELVQSRHHATVLQIGKAADVNDEFRPAVALRQLIARLFHISVGQSEPFSNLTKTGPGKQIC